MKKNKLIFILLLIFVLVCSCGRKNVKDEKGELRIAVTGLTSQIFVYPLAKENLVALAEPLPDCFKSELPVLGPLYGTRGNMNFEELIKCRPDIVIDVGEYKKGIDEEFKKLSLETGINFVHIDASFEKTGDMYRKLGKLIEKEKEAEILASYCDETYSRIKKFSDSVTKKRFLYVIGKNGTNVIAKNSYHSDVIDMLTDNLAVIDFATGKGTGNSVDIEQIIKWNPDYIVFSPDSIYDKVKDFPEWKSVNAVKENHYYQVPAVPYNWLGFPPAVNRYIGMFWLCDVLYKDECPFDFEAEKKKYFELFYGKEF